jgi:peptidoglycan/LPS O-acetylase OafA/YrhL
MSELSWRRLLYTGAALSILAMAIWLVFLIPQVKNQPGMAHGADWVFAGIQLFIAAMLFGIGFMNRRDGCLTRVLLILIGIGAILIGLVGLIAVTQEDEVNLFWKAIRVCAIDDIIIGIMALFACI